MASEVFLLGVLLTAPALFFVSYLIDEFPNVMVPVILTGLGLAYVTLVGALAWEVFA